MSDSAPSPEEQGEAFEVSVESDGKGQVTITVRREGVLAEVAINTPAVTDQEVEEFFRLLPAVVDQGLDAFVAQTTQQEENQPS